MPAFAEFVKLIGFGNAANLANPINPGNPSNPMRGASARYLMAGG